MGTHCAITAPHGDDQYATIYVHWDGYPEHALNTLQTHYTTPEKIEALIELGDLSVIAPNPSCPPGHTFDTPVDGYCIAYGRDRGETTNTEAWITNSIKEAIEEYQNARSYHYVYEHGEWVQYK